jgi:hypothetical protein
LHSAHDLDHLGWNPITAYNQYQAKKTNDKQQNEDLSAKWNPIDFEQKKSILTQFINDKLTDLTHVQVLDSFLSSDDKKSKVVKEHQKALTDQINVASEDKIKKITDALVKNSLSRPLWTNWIMLTQYSH